MVDDYDGIDYSRSNPPPDPGLKWETDLGIEEMQLVWQVAHDEIRDEALKLDPEQQGRIGGWSQAFINYINLRPNIRGAKSFVDWVQKNVPHEVPLFSMTFGQMFEEAISNRGMHPYNSTRTQTFWTGTWMQKVEGERLEQPYEGYGILTRPNSWSVIYQEDRSKGLSAGMLSGRIRTGRYAEKRPGVLVRTVMSNLWDTEPFLKVYPQNMGVLHSPGSAHRYLSNAARRAALYRLNEYIHLYGRETYEYAIERVIRLASAVANFMNDRDFHVLEDIKREIRRHDHARPVIESDMFSGLEKKVPKALLSLIGDAATLSEQLHLGKRAYDLFKVFYTSRWDGKGWREVKDRSGVPAEVWMPETLDPDHINMYHATQLGSYPEFE